MEELTNNNNNIKIMHSSTRRYSQVVNQGHRVNIRYQ